MRNFILKKRRVIEVKVEISCNNCKSTGTVRRDDIRIDVEATKRNQAHKEIYEKGLEEFESKLLKRCLTYCALTTTKYMAKKWWFFKEWEHKYSFDNCSGSIFNRELGVYYLEPLQKPDRVVEKEYFVVCPICDTPIYLKWKPVDGGKS